MTDFALTITPRFYETDALGHINNASIAAWFEMVRIGLLESLATQESATDISWILAALKLDFLAETFYGKDVEARISGAEVGNSSLTITCEMWQGDQLTVRGESVLVHFDSKSKQKMRIPDELRRKIEAV